MNTLDYTQLPQQVLNVTLRDGTKLSLQMPKKKMYTQLLRIKDNLQSDKNVEAVFDQLYSLVSEILSHNAENKVISKEYVENNLDFGDISMLISGYMKFVGTAVENPN